MAGCTWLTKPGGAGWYNRLISPKNNRALRCLCFVFVVVKDERGLCACQRTKARRTDNFKNVSLYKKDEYASKMNDTHLAFTPCDRSQYGARM